jgi:hypothetical protein
MLKSEKLQNELNKLWTGQYICKRYKVTPMSLIAWRCSGLPCVVIAGDQRPAVRFVPDEVLNWVKERQRRKARKGTR